MVRITRRGTDIAMSRASSWSPGSGLARTDTDRWRQTVTIAGAGAAGAITGGPAMGTAAAVAAATPSRSGTPAAARTASIAARRSNGLRVSEVVSLDVGDIDPARARLRSTTKSHREPAWVDTTTHACAAIDVWLGHRGRTPGPLFVPLDRAATGRTPTPLSARSVQRMLSRRGRNAGVGHIRPHGIRHTAITEVLDQTDRDLRSAIRFSRHADVRTLMLYDDARTRDAHVLAQNIGDTLTAKTHRRIDPTLG
jgi:integrase/recombinase XerC